MLSKKNRTDKKIVEKIFKEGRFVNSPNLSLKFIPPKDDSLPKASFISPKNASKSAVVRNLLRRRGYAVLKKYFYIFPKGFSGVFLFGKKSADFFGGRKNSKSDPLKNLDEEIKSILQKIRLL